MILYIRVCNFKSFKGEYTFRPIKDLTTVLGRSLSGKTNFAEALGFLVGMNYQQLRCTSYNELIHGFGTTVESAFVEANLGRSKFHGGQVTLQRRVDLHREGTVYIINGQEIEEEVYLEEIWNLGLSPLCLVLENKMDYFVRMSPMQRTSFIEKICGSQEQKENYDRAVSMKEKVQADFENLSQVLNMLQLKFKEMRKSSVEDDDRELTALEYHKRKLQEMKLQKVEKNIVLKTKARNKVLCEINVQELAKKEKQAETEDLVIKRNEMLQYGETLESIKTMQNEVMDSLDVVLSYKISCTYFRKLWVKLNKGEDCLKKRNKINNLMHDFSELINQIEMQDYVNGYNDNLIIEYGECLMSVPVDVEKQRAELEQKIMDLHWCQERLEFIREKSEYWESKLDLTMFQQYRENIKKELKEVNQQCEDLQTIAAYDEDKQKIYNLNDQIYNCEKNYINTAKIDRKKRVLRHLQAAYGKSKIDCLSELWTPKEEKYKKVIDVAIGEQHDMIIVETKATSNLVSQTLREMDAYEEVVALDVMIPRPTRVSSRIRIYDVIPIHHLMNIKEDYNPAVLNAVSNTYLCEKLNLKYKDLNNPEENVILMDGTFYEKSYIVSYTNIDLQNEFFNQEEEKNGNLEKDKVEVLRRLSELNMKIHIKSRLQSLIAKQSYLENENQRVTQAICDIQQEDQAEQRKQDKRKQKLEKGVKYDNKSEELHRLMEEKMEAAFGDSYMLRKKCKWEFRKYHELLNRKVRILNEQEIELRMEQLMKRILGNQKQFVKEQLEGIQEPATDIMYETKRDKDLNQLIITSDNAKNYLRNLKKTRHEFLEIEDELLLKYVTCTAAEVQYMNLKIQLHNLLLESLIKGIEVKTKMPVDIMSFPDDVSEIEEDYRYVVFYTISEQEEIDLGLEESKVNRLEEKIASNRLKRENGGEQRLKQSIQENINTLNDLKKRRLSLNNEIKNLHETREHKFMDCLRFLEKHVDKYYKELYQSQDCFAALTLQNKDEPYLDGVNYIVKVPGKSCVAMDCLTPQETNLASCIAIIALNKYKRTPFLFIDKPDAILDPATGSMFAKFMNKKKHGHTFISPKTCMKTLLPDECIGLTLKVENGIPCTTMFVLDLTEIGS